MGMPGRRFAAGNLYRYGFNGQEKSNEIDAQQNTYTAEFWQYDTRIGRRFNIDPIHSNIRSNYSVLGNNPIVYVDPMGMDYYKNDKTGETKWYKGNGKHKGYSYLGDKDFIFNTQSAQLSEVVVSASRKKIHYDIIEANTRTSCHITNEEVAMSQEIWWYNVTKDLDKAHGQIAPPRPAMLDVVMGHRTVYDPNFTSTETEYRKQESNIAIVNAQGYIIAHQLLHPKKYLTGIVPVGGINGGAGSIGFLIAEGGQLEQIFNDQKLFKLWLKGSQSLTRVETPLNAVEAQQLIDNAKKLGMGESLEFNLKGLQGLEKTGQWGGIPHFKIGNVHIPIQGGLEQTLKF